MLCLHSLCCYALNGIHIWRFCKGLIWRLTLRTNRFKLRSMNSQALTFSAVYYWYPTSVRYFLLCA